jgi:rhamnulokinase
MPSTKTFHCAAVDLGATSGRVVVGTWNGHKLRLTEVHRFPNKFQSLNGHDYVDLPGIWTEITGGLRKARKQFPKLAAVGA